MGRDHTTYRSFYEPEYYLFFSLTLVHKILGRHIMLQVLIGFAIDRSKSLKSLLLATFSSVLTLLKGTWRLSSMRGKYTTNKTLN